MSLKNDMQHYGVRVASVEPGFVTTPLTTVFKDNSMRLSPTTRLREAGEKFFKSNMWKGMSRTKYMTTDFVAKKIAEIMFTSPLPTRIMIETPAGLLRYGLASVLPPQWLEPLLA